MDGNNARVRRGNCALDREYNILRSVAATTRKFKVNQVAIILLFGEQSLPPLTVSELLSELEHRADAFVTLYE